MTHLSHSLRRLLYDAPRLFRSGEMADGLIALFRGPLQDDCALHELYDGVLSETVPKRLSEIVRRHRAHSGKN